MTFAGLPAAITLAGISWFTTEPAPMMLFSPMVTPGSTMTPAPSHTFLPMTMGRETVTRRWLGAVPWLVTDQTKTALSARWR